MTGENQNTNSEKEISRRSFVKGASAAAVFSIIPSHVMGGAGRVAPSDKLNIGCVGAGGKGRSDIEGVSSENVIALCDVDDTQMARFEEYASDKPEAMKIFNKANKYRDFRKMLDKEKDLDAIVVSTPDHTHAVIAIMAMKMGKHIYCQKPLTHTVYEARMMAKVAKENNVVTQMGNQGHASEGARLINEWIWDGAIGEVREVHAWTNRPIWPQAIDRPKEVPSVPPTLDWDVWQGPAPYSHYHPAYCPFAWRGWIDYGTGAVGDMGAHIMDHPFWALKLKYPTTIKASSTRMTKDSYPLASLVHSTFPARDNLPPVDFTWYDGGLTPPRPADLEPGRRMGDGGGGVLFVGAEGKLMCGTYGSNPRIIPEKKMQAYTRPEKTIPRSPGIYEEWIEAIKTGKKSTSDFSYAGPLTEAMLLGNIAIRLQEKRTILEWDPEKMEFPNMPEANDLVHKEYRQGWSL